MDSSYVPLDSGSGWGSGSDPYGLNSLPTANDFSNPYGLNSTGNSGSDSWATPATTDIFGNPTAGNAYNLGNSGTGTVPLQSGNWLSSLGNMFGGGSSGGGSNPVNNFLGNLGGVAGSSVPGMLALNYAQNQPGIDLSNLNSVFAQMGANSPAFQQSVLDPVRQQNAATFGQLEQNMGNRGLLGSSLESTALGNFNTQADRNLANAGASALNSSLGMQGNLAGNIAQLSNTAQQQKNQLYGTAFDVLGRGLNPQGYAGSTNITNNTTTNTQAGGSGGGGSSGGSGLGGLISSAIPIISSLFSDRRLKTDIKRVGRMDNGLPVYTYRYIMGGPVYMGVMADEAEKVAPHAVSEEYGFQKVDYGRI